MEIRKYVLAIVASMGCTAFGAYLYSRYEMATSQSAPVQVSQVAPFEKNPFSGQLVAHSYAPTDFTEAAEMSVNAVVHVKILKQTRKSSGYGYNDGWDGYNDPFLQFFFGQPRRQQQQNNAPYSSQDNMSVVGAGSGVIISEDGYIVTNNHVIDSADKIEIVLNDRSTYVAEVVGADPTTDIALLKIDAANLHYLQFGDSNNTKVGEWVLAIGNPFNLTSTVTTGIVSAKCRNISDNANAGVNIESFIQTDAAVNPGNSGGALVNTRGELIGINTAIASNTGSYTGYSFAVPSSIAQKVVQDLKKYGEVQRALLGVMMSEITPDVQAKYNLSDTKGVLVAELTDGGAAKDAGILPGDVILAIDGETVNSTTSLKEKIGVKRPGDSIKVHLSREGKEKDIVVTLRNLQGTTGIVKLDDSQKLLGATVESISADEMKSLRVRNGLKITKISDGKLKQAGIREGFVIVKANRVAVSSAKDLEAIIATSSDGLFISGIYPNGKVAYYAINLND